MTRNTLINAAVASAITLIQSPVRAQSGQPPLHVNSRWRECSFQLDPNLTQKAWRQFTREAGLVVYFRPLNDARPMGKGRFEISVLQWQTGIDDADAAWNDTFIHPDSTHWLFEGNGLKFPGLTARVGVTGNTDVAAYVTKNPGANYGFYGGQVQHNLVNDTTRGWATAVRVSFVSMYGPEDLDLTVYGADLVASRTWALTSWASVSPYAGVSTYLSRSHEKTAAVALKDEQVLGARATLGAELRLSKARLGAEFNAARVPSFSLKAGFGI